MTCYLLSLSGGALEHSIVMCKHGYALEVRAFGLSTTWNTPLGEDTVGYRNPEPAHDNGGGATW